MAYDEALADRIRQAIGPRPDLSERKMFGGIAFMVSGNMAVGVSSDGMMVRVGPEAYTTALLHPHTTTFGPAGREMTGWVLVQPQGLADAADFAHWVAQGVAFAETLPAK